MPEATHHHSTAAEPRGLTRRGVVGAILASQAIGTAALVPAPDPMLTLIERWIDGNRRYDETPSDLLNDIEDEQRAAEATYGPPLRELRDETPEVTTRAGAAAAIEAVLDDNLVMDWGNSVLRSVLTFLKSA